MNTCVLTNKHKIKIGPSIISAPLSYRPLCHIGHFLLMKHISKLLHIFIGLQYFFFLNFSWKINPSLIPLVLIMIYMYV